MPGKGLVSDWLVIVTAPALAEEARIKAMEERVSG
jgi:hypothetical protein